MSAIVILCFIVFSLYKFYSSSSWKPLSVVIVKSELETIHTRSPSSSVSGSSISYKTNIQYKYEVNGINYTNNTIYAGLGVTMSDGLEAQNLIDMFPVGKSVQAFYNPAKPQASALFSSRNMVLKVILVFLVILIPACFVFWFVFKKIKFL